MAITALSVGGYPGGRHSFTAKDAASVAGRSGDFTRLSVMGLPGGLHSFTAKDAAVEPPESSTARSAYSPFKDYSVRPELRKSDREILEIFEMLAITGILD